ncbi:hypothetical protein CIB48_g3172 [Xylaria polymorpha]|nr:hypothetical protein CIB48_g3172 [Xylaria polymorpha]
MYKTRLKKWGIAKNNKSKPIPGCSRNNDISVQKKPRQSAGPQVDGRGITNHNSAIATRHSRTPQAIHNIPPPDFYKLPEDAFRFTKVYFNTVRFRNPEPSTLGNTVVLVPVTAEWAGYLATVRCLFSLGRHRQAFQLVDMCCHRYKFVLSLQDLSLPDITIRALVTLSGLGSGLVEIFFNFAYKMCQIVLGPLHPFSILLQKFKEAGINNLVSCINAAFQYYVSSMVYIRPHPMVLAYGDYLRDLIDNKFVDAGHMLRQLLPLKQTLLKSQSQGQPSSQSNTTELTQVLQCRIAWLNFYTGRYEEAKELVSGILGEPLIDARVISGCGCYDILHKIAVAENRHESALDALKKAAEPWRDMDMLTV